MNLKNCYHDKSKSDIFSSISFVLRAIFSSSVPPYRRSKCPILLCDSRNWALSRWREILYFQLERFLSHDLFPQEARYVRWLRLQNVRKLYVLD